MLSVDAAVGARYSRLSDLTSFPDHFLFSDALSEASKVNLELLRLEVLSALIFNEQLAVPQTVYFSGVLGGVVAEIERAVQATGRRYAPRVLRQPFVPAMSLDYAEDPRGPLGFQFDRFNESHAAGMFVELDKGPEDPARVRRVASEICRQHFPDRAGAPASDQLLKDVGQVMGRRGGDLLALARSYAQGPCRTMAPPRRTFGARLHGALSAPRIRATLQDSLSAELRRDIDSFTAAIANDPNLTGRGALRTAESYAPYRHLVTGDLEQLINFILHHEFAERVSAGYTNIEALPGEILVDKVVRSRRGKLENYSNFSYNNRNFSAVSAASCEGRQDYVWESVWEGVARYLCDYPWMEQALALRPADPSTRADFLKTARKIIEGLSKSIEKDLVRFDVVEKDCFEKLGEKITEAMPSITLFKTGAAPLIEAGIASQVFAITLSVAKVAVGPVSGTIKPIVDIYTLNRKNKRLNGNLIRKVCYAKRLS
ncbi:hypothetical protein AS593_19420 [Caulobacter vibrioides]|nr:hypothetical protein AS593_19420 [Caulobacter vibrioides]